jgi:hypothetical protein
MQMKSSYAVITTAKKVSLRTKHFRFRTTCLHYKTRKFVPNFLPEIVYIPIYISLNSESQRLRVNSYIDKARQLIS